MKSVILLCILPFVLGGAIPGQDKCVWGPPYWCSHVSHARECGATKHCLQTVWKNQIIKPESTKSCTYCELIVNEIRDVLQDKTTEDDIANVMSNVCAVLPSVDYRNMCKDIVVDYAPELLQMFAEHISTDMICATVGMCSGLEDTWSPYGVKANNGSACNDCVKFFKDVQQSITSQETVNQLTQLVNQTICSELGSFGETCVDLVKQFLPVALQALADQLDPDIVCRVFGFCSADSVNVFKIKNVFQGRQSTEPLQYRSSEECDLCESLFKQIVDAIRDKDNQDKIIAELKTEVCDEFGSLADQCKELVDEYAPMLFELLVNELDPKTICETAGLCPTPSLLPVIAEPEEKPASMVGPGFIKDSTECTLCKYAVQGIVDVLEENQTVVVFEEIVEKVCDRLPAELKNQCTAFVIEYGPLVVNLTAQELKPDVVCVRIKLCTNGIKQLQTDLPCVLCEDVIHILEIAVENISATDLTNELKSLCIYLPGNYSAQCETYVSQYVPLIISLLQAKEDPHQLCMLAKVCTSSSTPEMTKPIPELIPVAEPSLECEVCGTVIMMVKTLMSNKPTEDEVEQTLEEVCKLLPVEVQDSCKKIVDLYGAKLIALLVQDLDAKTICSELGLCQALNKPLSQVASAIMSPYDTVPLSTPVENIKAAASPSIGCEVCDTVILAVKTLLGNKPTEDEVKQALEKVCTIAPASVQGACKDFIDQYGDRLIQLLVQELDAKTICTDLGLCPALTKPLSQLASAIMSPYDTLPLFIPVEDKKEKVEGSAVCQVCSNLIKYMEKELQDKKTEAAIEDALKKVCTEVKGFEAQCDDLIDTYLPVAINYFLLAETPDGLCKLMGLCSSRVENLPAPVQVTQLTDDSEFTPVKSEVTCELCKYVVEELVKLLEGNKSEAAIVAALDKVCTVMPDSLQSECKSFVNQYSQQIIDLLVKSIVDPNQLCSEIGLCAQEKNQVIPESDQVNGEISCALCEFAMKEVDKLLQGNRSEAAIQEALDKVCSLLPSTISTECQDLVDQYTPTIVQLLVNGLDPAQVCTNIKLCSALLDHSFGAFVKILPEAGIDGSVECEACELLVGEIRDFLKQNKTKEELDKFLKKVCNILPDTVTVQCKALMETEISEIIALLEKDLTPEEVCITINICPATRKIEKADDDTLYFKPHPKLLGQKKCTYGPSYWCASKENAKECNALQHCMNHVWN